MFLWNTLGYINVIETYQSGVSDDQEKLMMKKMLRMMHYCKAVCSVPFVSLMYMITIKINATTNDENEDKGHLMLLCNLWCVIIIILKKHLQHCYTLCI